MSSPVRPLNPLLPRLAAVVGVALILTTFVIAFRLTPNSNGLGTHQQMGFPPCSIRVLFGMRCPMCGMTTSWAHAVKGNWVSAIRVNTSGWLLFLYALFASWVGLSMLRTGQWPTIRVLRCATIAVVGIATTTVLEWTLRIF